MITVPKLPNMTPGKFISKMFEARNQTHILHLNTTSYAAHMALGSFYDGIVDLADSIAEQYQSKKGIIKGYECGVINESVDPLKYLESFRSYVETNRQTFGSYSEIQNTIDEVIDLCNSTIYKLKFLK